ncbi:unnamed protein product, partial [Polarella glacialis]
AKLDKATAGLGRSSHDLEVPGDVEKRLVDLDHRVCALEAGVGGAVSEEDAADHRAGRGKYGGYLAQVNEHVHQIMEGTSDANGAAAVAAAAQGLPAPAPLADDSRVENSARRAEEAARSAEAAAAAAQRLRKDLDQLRAQVEVAHSQSQSGAPPQDSQAQGEVVAEYLHHQMQIEQRLNELQEQLENDSKGETVMEGLSAVVKDVRQCLARCELLFQLPEIKLYIKRFRTSLEVNAVLQDKWMGPSARGRGVFDLDSGDEDATPGGQPPAERVLRQGDNTRSAPDLTSAAHARRDVPAPKSKKGQKKPFRTVTDWCRPHTPLNIDPVAPPPGAEASKEELRFQLPPISPPRA